MSDEDPEDPAGEDTRLDEDPTEARAGTDDRVEDTPADDGPDDGADVEEGAGPEPASDGSSPDEPGEPPEATGDGGSWWSRRSRGAKVGIVALAVVGVVLGGLLLTFNQPNGFATHEQPVSAETRASNSAIALSLARGGGINRSLVDVTDERVYVAYELPAYAYTNATDGNATRVNETTARDVQRFVLGVAAGGAGDAPRVVILQYDGETPRLAWDVQLSDFAAYFRGDLTLEEFESRIDVTRFDEDGESVT